MKEPIGRVYVLTNSVMPGLVKIGYTLATVEGRIKELFTTGVPSDFVIAYQVEVRAPSSLEAVVHKKLTEYRENQNREFFRCSVEIAISTVRGLAIEIIDEEIAQDYKYIVEPPQVPQTKIDDRQTSKLSKSAHDRINQEEKNQIFSYQEYCKLRQIEYERELVRLEKVRIWKGGKI